MWFSQVQHPRFCPAVISSWGALPQVSTQLTPSLSSRFCPIFAFSGKLLTLYSLELTPLWAWLPLSCSFLSSAAPVSFWRHSAAHFVVVIVPGRRLLPPGQHLWLRCSWAYLQGPEQHLPYRSFLTQICWMNAGVLLTKAIWQSSFLGLLIKI